jgi:alkanesulfonate monooxygenase SsuD/methylene tetrahydromethanopterin reductase-like flavin-dependent oxidoreductase (luciferase family)
MQTLETQPLTVSAGGPPVPSGPYGADIARAIGDGILTAQAAADPQQPVTRQEFVAWVVRALGYGPLLSMSNRVSVRFADAKALSGTDANAVGIAQGLGIVTGNAAGRFRPTSPATWAELATILMRAAQHETSTF